LRLDFTIFTSDGPAADGNCVDDFITISGSPILTVPMRICGQATGQHCKFKKKYQFFVFFFVNFLNFFSVYLPFGSSSKITVESLMTSASSTYSIKITQIMCDSPDLGNFALNQASSLKFFVFYGQFSWLSNEYKHDNNQL